MKTRADDAVEVDELDDEAESYGPADTTPRLEPSPRWVNWTLALSLVLAIAAPAVMAWVYFAQFQPAQEIDPQVEQQVLTAAVDGTVAFLSYAPATLDADFAKAKSHLTGEILTYYDSFTSSMVAPAVAEAASTSTASVIRKALVEIQPSTATVLLFVNQSQSNADNPEPNLTTPVIRVVMQKVDGAWLISELTPV